MWDGGAFVIITIIEQQQQQGDIWTVYGFVMVLIIR